MVNQRKDKRLEFAIPVHIKLLGMSKHLPSIEVVTRNISPVGILTELPVTLTNGIFLIHEEEKSINLIPYLALEEKEVELEITIPPHEETMRARGRVVWYDFCARETSDLCRVGILFKDIEVEARERWEAFVRNAASGTGRLWHHIQIVGAFAFFVGLLISIAGFWRELATLAKIGILVSFAGLIGFLIAWWQHRSFILLKKFRIS
jgi:hypothetical protein